MNAVQLQINLKKALRDKYASRKKQEKKVCLFSFQIEKKEKQRFA
jgi:hypothetical protein